MHEQVPDFMGDRVPLAHRSMGVGDGDDLALIIARRTGHPHAESIT
jgi:hypothetical protein